MSEQTQLEAAELPENNATPDSKGNEKYRVALELAYYEGQISWQMNVLFVGLNIGLGALLQKELENLCKINISTFILSIVGIIINIYWLGTFLRNNRYYKFRMTQARKAEPDDYSLVSGNGYEFSKGREVRLGPDEDDKLQLSWIERKCSNKNAVKVSIICFLVCFGLLLIWSIIKSIIKYFPHDCIR
ncbi:MULTISPECIES: hypothetical protein [Chryseobacterium]|uniref:hypothetical protein n=1 Tax=Chryseobacterium TaxID=59732 RepID=UPI0004800BE0|nr:MULTISPECIES: hypothetical protein [Chryseobacterium]